MLPLHIPACFFPGLNKMPTFYQLRAQQQRSSWCSIVSLIVFFIFIQHQQCRLTRESFTFYPFLQYVFNFIHSEEMLTKAPSPSLNGFVQMLVSIQLALLFICNSSLNRKKKKRYNIHNTHFLGLSVKRQLLPLSSILHVIKSEFYLAQLIRPR